MITLKDELGSILTSDDDSGGEVTGDGSRLPAKLALMLPVESVVAAKEQATPTVDALIQSAAAVVALEEEEEEANKRAIAAARARAAAAGEKSGDKPAGIGDGTGTGATAVFGAAVVETGDIRARPSVRFKMSGHLESTA